MINTVNDERVFRRVAASLSLGISVALTLYLTIVVSAPIRELRPTFRLRRFFTAQAEALLSGHLWVNPTDAAQECFTSLGHCYGYFGLTPSIARLPFLPFTGAAGLTDWFIPALIILGIAGNLALFHLIWISTSTKRSTWDVSRAIARLGYLAGVLIVGPGSLFLQLSLPTGYEEAIAWASAASSWALVCVVVWIRNDSVRWLVVATALFVFAANARPSAAPIAAVVGGVILLYLMQRGQLFRKFATTMAALALAIFPGLTMIAVWRAKFHVLVPPLSLNEQVQTERHWLNTMAVNGGHDTWWGFVPSNLLQYLRPDSLRFVDGSLISVRPNLQGVTYLPPLETGALFVTPMASVTALVPALAVLGIVAVLALPRFETMFYPSRGGKLPRVVTLGILAAAWSSFALLLLNVGVQNRYMADLIPAVTVTTGLGLVALVTHKRSESVWNRILLWLILAAAVAGVIINVLHAEWQVGRYLGA